MSSRYYRIGMVAIIALLVVIFLVYQLTQPVSNLPERPYVTERNQALGFSLAFPTGDAGYYLDQSVELDEPDGLRKVMTLVPYQSLKDYWEPSPGTETPPAITAYIFDNLRSLTLADWLRRFNDFSRLSLALAPPTETTINGAPAVRYEADGLYRANVVAVESSGKIVLLIGEFHDRNSYLYTDFWSVVASFAFAD